MTKELWPEGIRDDFNINGFPLYDTELRLEPGWQFSGGFERKPAGSNTIQLWDIRSKSKLPKAKNRKVKPLRSVKELSEWLCAVHEMANSVRSWGDDDAAGELLDIAVGDAVKWLRFFMAKGAGKPATSTGRPVGGQKDPAVQKRNNELRKAFNRDREITPAKLRDAAAEKGYNDMTLNVAKKLLMKWKREPETNGKH